MTAPTQQLPSWLSVSTSIATDAAGQPTATFTTLINLPLTYYGPSIPLGTDGVWVYGGPSSPAASLPTTFIPATPSSTPSTPATPSTSALSSTASSTLSSTLTSPSPSTTSLAPTSTPSSKPPSSTTSSVPASGFSSHSSTHTGVIIGSVLGSILGSLLLLFLFIFLLRKRQRRQQHRGRRAEPPTSQVMWMWHDVDRNDYDPDADPDAQLRSPGEGSPVGSGDERDAFLRRTGDAPGRPRSGEPTARLVDAPRSSQDSSGRPIGIALTSGASVAIASGTYGRKSSRISSASDGARHVISREQLAQAQDPVSPQSPDFPKSPEEAELGPEAPLLPPPAFNLNVSHGSRKSLLNSERSMTPGNDPESAMLYTAQRVRVDKNAVPSSSSGTSWPEAIGIPSILRRSWLSPKPRSNTPTTLSNKSSLLTRQLTDNELEVGRSLNAQLRTEMGYRDGARPISAVSTGSARSGNTMYYDAQSRDDVASTPPPVPPLPQGTTSTGRSGAAHAASSPLSGDPIRAPDDSELPPAYEPKASGSGKKDDLADILDLPAPRPASPFASVSSARALSPPPPPPGLTFPSPLVWRDPASTPANTSAGIDIDLLEEAPPAAGESWRQLARGSSLHERRTTFGMPSSFVPLREPTTISEHGSLHSIRSHLSPRSALSAAGSAPVSNSASEHSRGFTVNSLKSLAHSSSISSTDRRLTRASPGEVSPALSALGRPLQQQQQQQQHPHRVPPLSPTVTQQSATVTSTTTTRSSVTTHTSVTDPVTGEVSRVAHAVWTGGRERERGDSPVPAAELGAWGEGWSSPSHLRILQNRVAGRDGASHG